MNHPELIVVPLLMLADYALTILGAKLALEVYRQHFVMPSYELNPVWRTSVDRIRWFNPRHFTVTILIAVLLVWMDRAELLTDETDGPGSFDLFEFLLGILFGAYGAVCGRHLGNLLQFRYLNRHPQEIAGQVQLSMKLIMKISQYTYLGWVPLIAIIVWLKPSAYTIGILLGLLTLVFAHFVWGRKAKSLQTSEGKAGS